MTFDQLILEASSRGASDIHLRADHVPLVRVDGTLERWTHVAAIGAATALALSVLLPVAVLQAGNAAPPRANARIPETTRRFMTRLLL